MKRIYLLLTIFCALTACKKNNVDFTYTPAAPRAGESVYFSNQSSSGEEWSWTYGDGAISTIKSPSHIYKQPGTYRVTLKVDKKDSWTATKEITVYDTVPTYACDDSIFSIYKDYTFKAVVYNPYNYEVTYQWYMTKGVTEGEEPYAIITDTTAQNSTLHLYFTRPMSDAGLGLVVVLNGDTTFIEKTFGVDDRATNAVLTRTNAGDYRQRIFGSKATEPVLLPADDPILDNEQDTFQVYNKDTFTLSILKTVFPDIQGFHIAKRKIYYRRANGLWVANIDGAHQVQIEEGECPAMTLDMKDSRIYWANAEGVWYMPFVGSDNNKFVTIPAMLNELTGVTKLAADTEMK